MLKVTPETRKSFLTESTHKELNIDVIGKSGKRIEDVNFCTSYTYYNHSIEIQKNGSYAFMVASDPWDADVTNHQLKGHYQDRKYVGVRIEVTFYDIKTMPDKLNFGFEFTTDNAWLIIEKEFDVDKTENTMRLSLRTRTDKFIEIKKIYLKNKSDIVANSKISAGAVMIMIGDELSDLESRDFVTESSPDTNLDDLYTTTLKNEDLVTESFSLTESLCSQNNIKFGLCEAAYCEFTMVDRPMNLNERVIKPYITVKGSKGSVKDINLEEKDPDYYHAIWRNTKLKNKQFTSSRFNANIKNYVDKGYFDYSKYICFTILIKLNINSDSNPYYFRIGIVCGNETMEEQYWMPDYTVGDNKFKKISDYSEEFAELKFYLALQIDEEYQETYGKYIEYFKGLYIYFYDENQARYTTGDISLLDVELKNIQINIVDKFGDNTPSYNPANNYAYRGEVDDYMNGNVNIPLGVFNITSIKKQFERTFNKRTITAYDNLVKLEQNAYDWYTQYMFGINTTTAPSRYGFEFARQVYSSFWNYCIKNELDSRENYTETQIGYWDYQNDIKNNHKSDKYIKWETTDPIKRVRYAYFNVNDVDVNKRYMVDFTNTNGISDQEMLKSLPDTFFREWDKFGRGIGTNASVLIDETRSNGNHNKFLCDKRDYFKLSPDCISFTVYVPMWTAYDDGSGLIRFLDNLSIYRIEEPLELENGHIRLLYYNWMEHQIFEADTSITGRDVVRSLLEICGCFFRLSRDKGLPEFVYCTKSGLYPSNKLYPSEDLYPRQLDGDTLSMGKYEAFEAEDYEVINYGRIQIKRNDTSNATKSVCEWEYIGNSKNENTYIIDDNIFYCNREMMYDYDSMPEVSEMLINMFQRISNMGYVPNITRAVGMPYMECGDRIGLMTLTGGVQSFIFRRTLKGIQNLHDTYESVGDEYTPAIKDYGYSIWEK